MQNIFKSKFSFCLYTEQCRLMAWRGGVEAKIHPFLISPVVKFGPPASPPPVPYHKRTYGPPKQPRTRLSLPGTKPRSPCPWLFCLLLQVCQPRLPADRVAVCVLPCTLCPAVSCQWYLTKNCWHLQTVHTAVRATCWRCSTQYDNDALGSCSTHMCLKNETHTEENEDHWKKEGKDRHE
jgi:hypothetical protein